MNAYRWLIQRLRSLRRITTPRGEASVELRQPWLPVLFLLALIWHILYPSQALAFAAALLAGMCLVGYIWARQMATRVECSRKLRYSAFQVGDELEEVLRLENHSRLPVLWAEYLDRSEIPSYSVSSVQAVAGRGSNEWRSHMLCARRGVYRLGPWEVLLGEPFGVFQARIRHQTTSEIIVYPPLAQLPAELIPHAHARGAQRRLRQPSPAETIHAATTRPYAPGDPLRRIHWRTTARRSAPFVKMFEPESSAVAWLIPDFDAGVQRVTDVHLLAAGAQENASLTAYIGGERQHLPQPAQPSLLPDTLEALVILTASLAALLLQEGMAVGVYAAGMQAPLQPRAGRDNIWPIMRALAPVQPADQNLKQTLQQARLLARAQDLLVVITPSLNTAWREALGQTGGPANNVQGTARVLLLDPASFDLNADPQGRVEAARQGLAGMGLAVTVIRREQIHPVLGVHGALRRWEFKTLGTGRVIASATPRLVEKAAP